MKVDDVAGSCGLVQAVDVLRDDPHDQPQVLELRNRMVATVGLGVPEVPPTQMAPRPITASGQGIAYERLIVQRRASTSRTGGSAVVRYPRLCRDPCTTEDD